MREAKDTWLQHKAAEAERGRHGGKIVWRCIRDIQRARRGLMPERTARVRDEDGSECTSAEAQQERWKKYFTKIVNIQSEFDVEELRKMRQRPPRPEMADLPSEEELLSAVVKLKIGNAGGESGMSMVPEMVLEQGRNGHPQMSAKQLGGPNIEIAALTGKCDWLPVA